MEHIPPLGWAAIAVIVLITLGVNAGMVALLHRRAGHHASDPHRSALTPGRTARDAGGLEERLRHPLHEEEQRLDELARRVQALKEKPPDDSGSEPVA